MFVRKYIIYVHIEISTGTYIKYFVRYYTYNAVTYIKSSNNFFLVFLYCLIITPKETHFRLQSITLSLYSPPSSSFFLIFNKQDIIFCSTHYIKVNILYYIHKHAYFSTDFSASGFIITTFKSLHPKFNYK